MLENLSINIFIITIMDKKVLLHLKTIIMVAMFGFCLISCSSDDEDSNSLRDPEGTVTAVMKTSSSGGVNLFDINGNQVSLYVNSNFSFTSDNFWLDIHDCGKVEGLASITSIPTSGWVNIRSNPAAQIGHGYIIRYKNTNFNILLYARVYIVGEANDGLSIKYQSPFDPSKDSGVNNGSVNPKEVLGTWIGFSKSKKIFTFLEDGTGTFVNYKENSDDIDESSTFTYKMETSSRGSINTRYNGRDETWYFEVSGNKMTIYDNPNYVSADWILTKQ